MKKFNFEEALKMGSSSQKVNWLKDNWNKSVSEEEFINAIKSFKLFSKGKKKNYCPSKLKRQYQHLKKTFGFFK